MGAHFNFLSRYFYIISEMLPILPQVSPSSKNGATTTVSATTTRSFRRYDCTYIPYIFSLNDRECIAFFETLYDETHRAYSKEPIVTWHDSLLGSNTESTLLVDEEDPSQHTVLSSQYNPINEQYRYFWAGIKNQEPSEIAKRLARHWLSSSHNPVNDLKGSILYNKERLKPYNIDVDDMLALISIDDNLSTEIFDNLILIKNIAESISNHELVKNLSIQEKMNHPIYCAGFGLVQGVGNTERQLMAIHEILNDKLSG